MIRVMVPTKADWSFVNFEINLVNLKLFSYHQGTGTGYQKTLLKECSLQRVRNQYIFLYFKCI